MSRALYYRLPSVLQDALVTLEGWRIKRERMGREFRSYLQAYLNRDHWDEQQLAAWRFAQRSAALERASAAPYYQRFLQAHKADWRDFIDDSGFRQLPVIRKQDFVDDIDAFRTRDAHPTDRFVTTSGTTGTSLGFPISAEVEPSQWAVWWRYRIRHGIRPGTRCGLFASAPIMAPGDDSSRPYRVNRANNEVRFSIFHISPERVEQYAEAFRKHDLRWVHGNPTAIAQFCQCYLETGKGGPIEIDHLTVGSENLTPLHIQAMRAVFGREPRQHYGLAEPVANISELPDGRLAVDEDFAYAEFLETPDSDLRRIVGTAFCNTALAMLRYDTGDLCTLADGVRDDAAQRYVATLDGRSTDYIELPGGRRVASLAGPFHATIGLAAAQLVQHSDGALTVRYVPGHGWQGETTLSGLETELRKRVGDELPLRFKQVEDIPKTERGKSRLVISEMKTRQRDLGSGGSSNHSKITKNSEKSGLDPVQPEPDRV